MLRNYGLDWALPATPSRLGAFLIKSTLAQQAANPSLCINMSAAILLRGWKIYVYQNEMFVIFLSITETVALEIFSTMYMYYM